MQPKEPEYTVLSQDEMDEMVVNTMLANERDLFAHRLSKERLEAMLPTLAEGPWKERISGQLNEIDTRIGEVASIIAATRPQMPPDARKDAAVSRIKARADAARASR